MADVTFDEEPQYASSRTYASVAAKTSNLSSFLQRMGIAKTQHGAEIVLLVIAGIAGIAAIAIYISSSHTPKLPPSPPTVVHQPQ